MQTQINIGLFEKRLKIRYYLFWAYLVLLIILGELSTFMHGVFADNGQVVYAMETFLILLTAGSIPLALKLFSKNTSPLRNHKSVSFILAEYQKWSNIRLLILAFVFTLALLTHYLCMSSAGSLCAILIGFTAFFCIPSKSKLLYLFELHMTNKKEGDDE